MQHNKMCYAASRTAGDPRPRNQEAVADGREASMSNKIYDVQLQDGVAVVTVDAPPVNTITAA
ncbi:MAG: hypothetical protein KDJ16_06335, partial [Hyphomicrobiales bacterium]|nr:hypothetical protein [Hyphomicrobiales bacterium]